MRSDQEYIEIPERDVMPGVVRTANAIAEFVAKDLSIPTPRVRWIAKGHPPEGRRARRMGRVTYRPNQEGRLLGFYRKDAPDSVFIEIGATPETIAHEVRHVWQARKYRVAWHPDLTDTLERDAEMYAHEATGRWRRERARRID